VALNNTNCVECPKWTNGRECCERGANVGVAFSGIDVEAATSRGIFVTNTPSEEISVAVAEATWALLLAVAKRIVEGDR